MVLNVRRAVSACLFFFASQSLAQQTSYQITSFDEDLSASVSVSGTVMASYLVSGQLPYASADALYIYVIPEQRLVNASISSIDGKYAAEMELTHSMAQAGWIQVQFPSKFKQDLQAYAAEELVAYIYSDSEDKFGYYIQEVFPSSWGAPEGNARSIFINSAGFKPEYSYKNTAGETVVGRCVEIENKLTRAYNHRCDFSLHGAAQPALVIINTTPDGIGKKFLIWSGS
ncbi:MAG: hypothetical protein KKE30_02730 [Gammaproteobacteria bacterium]|nr:hypothetical protein [Gammaproteobacteria bacterium]MBU1554181.1 hypothetical protein [Gammaproteobacteria bacterium]MBU2071498.1 hypothetical protein [Gammaproteobacteria bacterium]MBU2183989.1 hypothetical protein [Gammaproteobacteria bacterium]MBU2206925.1 hypothetical protein [Gammaproteobacteria bacterium]